MRFIHVIRDGRDMMLSLNQNQAEKHGIDILGLQAKNMKIEERAIRIWNSVNLRAKHIGQSTLGANYLCVRFEDLCQTPEETLGIVAEFCGLPIENLEMLSGLIQRPSAVGAKAMAIANSFDLAKKG